MRPLYIMGTERNVGKTTMSLGLLHAFRHRGLRVGYLKPLGQRFGETQGHVLHDDARLVASCFGVRDVAQADIAVALPSGRVEREVFNPRRAELLGRVMEAYEKVSAHNDLVVIEGMGHVAMGGCLGLSAGDVCREMGAKALLISGGGVGKAIDEIFLCATFLASRQADLIGVIVNKVWPQKFTKVKQATTRGLENLGIRSLGTVPYEEQLAAPTMGQVFECVGGQLVGGRNHLDHRVKHTIIAAMQSSHMIHHIKGSTLVITPGDRSDNILACMRAHMLGDPTEQAVSGLILTGDFPSDPQVLGQVEEFHLPVISVKEDTFTAANKIINTVFKIQPGDRERIQWAVCLAAEYVDVDAILESLKEP